MLDVSSIYTDTSTGTSPNIMPLLDVMLLLLIFFLLASVFVRPTLDVDLPQATQSDPTFGQDQQITIVVTEAGDIFVNQTPVPLPKLPSHLEAALAQDKTRQVIVRADHQSRFQNFVGVMDAAQGAGAEQLIIETRRPAAGTSP
jgi:biopolymer transport protein ExbD